MARKLDIVSLRALYAVNHYGSFSAAAEALNVTQSTISHQIRKLEQLLDRQLLKRTTRALYPTPEGELLLKEAHEILSLIDAAEERLSDEKLVGEVRFGFPEEMANAFLSDLLARFRECHPSIRLALTVGVGKDLLKGIERHHLDLVLVKQVPSIETSMGKQDLCWAGSQRLLKLDPIPLAFFPEPCVFRSQAIKKLEESNINYDIVMTTTSNQSLHCAARSGLALTVLASSHCPQDIRLDDQILLPKLPDMGYELCLSSRASTPAKYLQKLIQESMSKQV